MDAALSKRAAVSTSGRRVATAGVFGLGSAMLQLLPYHFDLSGIKHTMWPLLSAPEACVHGVVFSDLFQLLPTRLERPNTTSGMKLRP